MLLGHHPYALSGACQLSEAQKQNEGDNAVERNIAFTDNGKESHLHLEKSVGTLAKCRYGLHFFFNVAIESDRI